MIRFATVAVAVVMLLAVPFVIFGKELSGKPPLLHAARQAESDLEVGGELAGLPPDSTRFIAYQDLLALPQATYTVSDDSNFPKKTRISGIPLEQLAAALGTPTANLVVAICYDGYRANYPSAYLGAHHPLLVLKINGKAEPHWPLTESGGSMGPYLISHPFFKPSFRILSHTDEAQIPYGVTRIEFREEQAVFGSIAPVGQYDADGAVIQGYRIAQQNCFRCHNMGAEGGQLAGRSWPMLAMWASTEPKYFVGYVKNPQAFDAKNRMPGNPQYDAETLETLRRYFATFAATSAVSR
ncbi:hypothetical protein ACPOL_5445 [Acidisarcina polymorpha]|uniref:Cytochrome c domain-containing protein n=1 Tax=Acidisarcina polymorpha TaxID=2211140 RepID=A0A2Z5G624_9BACT|nr:c-type cytochrome [Acidisarcina polymorpha]AXC14693.1 hypothetical protein ACPOL_5445 [Acidisarcina polymorpha]